MRSSTARYPVRGRPTPGRFTLVRTITPSSHNTSRWNRTVVTCNPICAASSTASIAPSCSRTMRSTRSRCRLRGRRSRRRRPARPSVSSLTPRPFLLLFNGYTSFILTASQRGERGCGVDNRIGIRRRSTACGSARARATRGSRDQERRSSKSAGARVSAIAVEARPPAAWVRAGGVVAAFNPIDNRTSAATGGALDADWPHQCAPRGPAASAVGGIGVGDQCGSAGFVGVVS